MNIYDIGNVVNLTADFTTSEGIPIDPSTVALKVLPPGGTIQTYTGAQLTKVSTGVYTYGVLGNVAGIWLYRWEGSGNITAASDSSFKIVASSLS